MRTFIGIATFLVIFTWGSMLIKDYLVQRCSEKGGKEVVIVDGWWGALKKCDIAHQVQDVDGRVPGGLSHD